MIKFLKWIVKALKLDRLCNLMANLGLKFCLICSIVLGVAAVAGGLYIKNTLGVLFSISCVALGCFLSGLLFQSFLSKVTGLSKSQSDDAAQKEISELKLRLEQEESKHKMELENQKQAAKGKINELEGRLTQEESQHKTELSRLEQELSNSRSNETRLKTELENVDRVHQEALNTKDAEISSLKAECTRLGKQRIDVNALRPVLELALAEVDMHIKDVDFKWDRQSFDGEQSGFVGAVNKIGTLGLASNAAECKQYTGILEYECKSVFGIDMKNLKIRSDPERKTVKVYGIQAKHIGNKEESSHWLLREVQTFKLKKVIPDDTRKLPDKDTSDGLWQNGAWYEKDVEEEASASLDLNACRNNYEAQENILRERMSKGGGENFKPVHDYVVSMGKAFIKLLLAPLLKEWCAEIEFVDDVPTDIGTPIMEFIEEFNNSDIQDQKLLAAPSTAVQS